MSLSYLALSLARCIAICKPLHANRILTHKKAKFWVMVILFVVAVVQVPNIFAYSRTAVYELDGNVTAIKHYTCKPIKGEIYFTYFIQVLY